MTPIEVLCVSDYFLPGFKAGGPIRTLKNIPLLLGGAVTFSYLTRDRDLGCKERYDNITSNEWAFYPHGRVFYATEAMFGLPALSQAICTSDASIIYLNSFFSVKGSIAIVVRNWAKPFGKPILLAPRGEFSPGAFALKKYKKRLFMVLARVLGLYRRVWWHASTKEEQQDILRHFPRAESRIFTAEDPVEMVEATAVPDVEKTAGIVRLVFVSRISPKKNLKGLLDILKGLSSRIILWIYGPIEDVAYWQRCQAMIDDMPPNIAVEYLGELRPDEVRHAFAEGDLFAFPTHGENFGHVIFEALSAGTPVLVSDQTPWEPNATKAVIRLSLNDIDAWRAQIETVAQLTNAEQQERRTDALRYARNHASCDKTRQDNLRMFQEIARRNQTEVSE
ncbi:hypothetical protein ACFB49_40680 [Sphingomonas sp. DBB INV C78]|uniref:glycosyltransferase family 4 protein n=1 Tax=Sphingomonas sp. DBB INV C78 TaxID=3349434 RepID=UPI0036D2D0F6